MKVIEQEIAALKNTINEMWALVHQLSRPEIG